MSAVSETLQAYQRDLAGFRKVERRMALVREHVPEGELVDLVVTIVETTRATLEQNENVVKALMQENALLTRQIQNLKERLVVKGGPAMTEQDKEMAASEPMFFAHIREAWSMLRHGK